MSLRTLLLRTAAAAPGRRPAKPPRGMLDAAALRAEWDRRRADADSAAERHEIDAIYSRVVP